MFFQLQCIYINWFWDNRKTNFEKSTFETFWFGFMVVLCFVSESIFSSWQIFSSFCKRNIERGEKKLKKQVTRLVVSKKWNIWNKKLWKIQSKCVTKAENFIEGKSFFFSFFSKNGEKRLLGKIKKAET
jgi:hypothetical protein